MKKSKVIIVLVIAITLLYSITAQAGPALDRILKRGELIVGTSATQPPLTLKSKEGEIIGFDIDLSRYMAEAMGVRLRIVSMPFSELLTALESGRVDMILSGMTITPKRNLKFAYVGPYYTSGKGLLTKIKTIESLKENTDINQPDFSIAALKGSTSQTFIEKTFPKAKLVLTENLDKALDMVIQDNVNALITDYPTCVVFALRFQNKGLVAGDNPLTFEPLGIALPANDHLMVNWVENVLFTLKSTGKLEKMLNRWLKDTSWLSRLP
jgi:polar amino acid transport system substrate-binding protein